MHAIYIYIINALYCVHTMTTSNQLEGLTCHNPHAYIDGKYVILPYSYVATYILVCNLYI